MRLNRATLARVQFAFTVSIHAIFATMSIGLAMFLAIVEGFFRKTRDALYLKVYRFWLSIFTMGLVLASMEAPALYHDLVSPLMVAMTS